MTTIEKIALFVNNRGETDLSAEVSERLKGNVLDTIGCAIAAIDAGPVRSARDQLEEFGGNPLCQLIGGGRSAPDRAAFSHTAASHYLDMMDCFVRSDEVCHPSDNWGGLVATADVLGAQGKDFLTALAIAYQIQCRIIETLPVMRRGFNHTTALALSIAAGCAKLMGLDFEKTANALGLAGTKALELAVLQAEPITQWTELSPAETAMHAVFCAFLARRGITGPRGVFEGPFGINAAVADRSDVDWETEPLDIVNRTSLRQHDAEIHAQTAVEAALDLREESDLKPDIVDKVSIETFRTAFQLIGGGKYGDKSEAATPEQAEHNLKYLVAAAILDGEVTPRQFTTERIQRDDIQALMKRVTVKSKLVYSQRYPDEMPSRISVILHNGRLIQKERRDYEGFYRRPLSWEKIEAKFHRLTAPFADESLRKEIVQSVRDLEQRPVADLMRGLERVRREAGPMPSVEAA